MDNPWTEISRAKIVDHLQSRDSNSCFWPFRKRLGVKTIRSRFIRYCCRDFSFDSRHARVYFVFVFFKQELRNDTVLIGYKPFSDTGEEFLICTTDRAKQYVEETQTQIEREMTYKMERRTCRVSGPPWVSKTGDNDVEEETGTETREKVYARFVTTGGFPGILCADDSGASLRSVKTQRPN